MRRASAASVVFGLLLAGDAVQVRPDDVASPAAGLPKVGKEAEDAIERWLEEQIRLGNFGPPVIGQPDSR